MSKLRSVSTSFWSDPWVEDLNPSEKLLYLYFITNEKTNMLGIYELSIKKISFETGLNKDVIEKCLIKFQESKKINYIENYVVILNYTKHQKYNPNMVKNAIDVFNLLPKSLNPSGLKFDKENPLEDFETLRKALGMVSKVEVEIEDEIKLKTEEKNEVKKSFDLETFDFNFTTKKIAEDFVNSLNFKERPFDYCVGRLIDNRLFKDKKDKVSKQAYAAMLKRLEDLSGKKEESEEVRIKKAIELTKRAIEGNWKTFYAIKEDKKPSFNNNQDTNTKMSTKLNFNN